jgi:hypothetical protein
MAKAHIAFDKMSLKYVRENRRSNLEYTIQRQWQHWI